MSTTIIHDAASIVARAPGQFIDRTISCISGPTVGCSSDNWDHSPNSGFYTVCCDGNIIDVSGFNSWANYTLLLENLICCPHEKGDDAGPIEILHCNSAKPTALSELLATSTEVAQNWMRGTSTVEPECFWSQFGEDQMMESTSLVLTSSAIPSSSSAVSSTDATVTPLSTTSTVRVSASSTAVSSKISVSSRTSSESPVSSSDVATSETTTPSPTAVPTGAGATNRVRSGVVVVCALLLLGLTY